ncbi:MAG: hypothetical protein IPL75_13375 [Acidobacteria bacterium]|nr:hypothetical protein [Acidobacteriota bacterium]
MTRQLLNNAAYRTAADAMVPERFRLANGETLPTCVQWTSALSAPTPARSKADW